MDPGADPSVLEQCRNLLRTDDVHAVARLMVLAERRRLARAAGDARRSR